MEYKKMENRLARLEIKVAELEDALDAVNHTAYRQQQQIDQLQQQFRQFYQQMQTQNGASESRSLRDEIPPHY